jgi:hypothetical protein
MNAPQSHKDTETVNDLTDLTGRIIHCAITVHKALGPGLLEKTYEAAMCIELDDAGLRYERQKEIAAFYKATHQLQLTSPERWNQADGELRRASHDAAKAASGTDERRTNANVCVRWCSRLFAVHLPRTRPAAPVGRATHRCRSLCPCVSVATQPARYVRDPA